MSFTLQDSSNVIFTVVQQRTRFQLAVRRAVPAGLQLLSFLLFNQTSVLKLLNAGLGLRKQNLCGIIEVPFIRIYRCLSASHLTC